MLNGETFYFVVFVMDRKWSFQCVLLASAVHHPKRRSLNSIFDFWLEVFRSLAVSATSFCFCFFIAQLLMVLPLETRYGNTVLVTEADVSMSSPFTRCSHACSITHSLHCTCSRGGCLLLCVSDWRWEMSSVVLNRLFSKQRNNSWLCHLQYKGRAARRAFVFF